ncbi:MAG: amino acid transporter [Sphingomonadales bacterium]|nr:amino acid transporter [Sphingomonadales bacterium]
MIETLDFVSFVNGFLLSLGLIVAIGPQNAYVLRKGLKRHHVFAVTTTCFLSDALLIFIAVAGIGTFITNNPRLADAAAWGGAAFLLWYGYQTFKSAKHPDVISQHDIDDAGGEAQGKGMKAAILMAIAMTYLNPHVYLDTFVIIGGIAAQFDDNTIRWSFGIGAITASAVWFYGIGYGARLFAPIFRSTKAWRVLDIVITLIMWSMACLLIWFQLIGHDALH